MSDQRSARLLTGSIEFAADGSLLRTVGVAADVTERKQSADSFRNADRRKDELLAMLAHELRNPLASVSNAIQLLRMPELSQANAEWSKDIIDREADASCMRGGWYLIK